MADDGARSLGAFAALPHALLLAVLALLPVDTRLYCREVCRDWHAALEDVSLWARLDMSAGSGVAAAHLAWRRAEGLLEAAALRAGGQLQRLDVTGCVRLDLDALRGVVGGNAAMRQLSVGVGFHAEALAELLRAAPQLLLLQAPQLECDDEEEFEVLRDEQLFRPLRARLLRFHAVGMLYGDMLLPLALRLVATAAPTELDLRYVRLYNAADIGAVVDAALAHQVCVLSLEGCELSATAAPALARLLDGGAVTKLMLRGEADEELWADEAGAAQLCHALRANTSLCELQVSYFQAWNIPAAGAALLGALTGHPSLRKLDLTGNEVGDDAQQTAAAAAALGALVAADTLTHLDVSESSLSDAALGLLFDALPAVTRLLVLDCFCGSHEDDPDLLSDAFIRTRMVPALRANASLRKLQLGLRASTREAQAVVNSPARR